MTDQCCIPFGRYTLRVRVNAHGISNVEIYKKPLLKTKNKNKKIIQMEREVQKFLCGNVSACSNIVLDVSGTLFQKKVWEAARRIPYGETRTYGQIAMQIGSPKAVRAVGTALRKNPVCIVVPCHRVVPQSGGIGNYAYGTVVKRWLLKHENANCLGIRGV